MPPQSYPYEDQTGRWIIQHNGFYWDSSQTKEDFFQELKSYFQTQGENSYREKVTSI